MLGNAKVIAFAATADSARARAFYHALLGLDVLRKDDFALVLDAGGTELRIQKVAAFAPLPHTLLGWSVASIDHVLAALGEKGVAVERYPFLEQDGRGVWTSPSGARVAWLKDPDGNLLSLTEPANR